MSYDPDIARQSSLDLVSHLDDHVDVTEGQSYAAASLVEALVYIGDQLGRVADSLEKRS